MYKKEYFYILIVIVLVIALFFEFNIFRGNCDSKGCMDKNGCYTSLKENQMNNFMNCNSIKGYEWDECKQTCKPINYSDMPDNYTLCGLARYKSYFKAININEVSENITTTHFCDYLRMDNNETCDGNDYWEYMGSYNKCSTLRFK